MTKMKYLFIAGFKPTGNKQKVLSEIVDIDISRDTDDLEECMNKKYSPIIEQLDKASNSNGVDFALLTEYSKQIFDSVDFNGVFYWQSAIGSASYYEGTDFLYKGFGDSLYIKFLDEVIKNGTQKTIQAVAKERVDSWDMRTEKQPEWIIDVPKNIGIGNVHANFLLRQCYFDGWWWDESVMASNIRMYPLDETVNEIYLFKWLKEELTRQRPEDGL